MKLAALLVPSLGLFWASTEAVTTLSIGTCEELQDAAQATSSDEVVGELVNGGVSCDAWTTFEIAANRLKLVAPEDSCGGDDVFAFNNVRFLVASAGTLRVLPRVEFTGDDKTTKEVNGGVLNVAEGGRVRFKSGAYMHDVEVMSVKDEGSDISSDQWFGGCIYNKGTLTFDDGFDASDCFTDGGGESAPGDGSGIWNGETGVVVMKGDVTFTDCGTRDINGNNGGAIYNAGKFSVFDDANFTGNRGSAGGAIYNKGVLKFLKNSMAVFVGNRASDTGGGHVNNVTPGTMLFNGGASFTDGFSEYSGGAIKNDGTLRISKSASFIDNGSDNGGAIFTLATSDLSLPEDTVFEGNYLTAGSFSDCENIYSHTEDSFECLP